MNKVTSIIPVSIFAILAGLFISGGVYATQASTNTEVALNVDSVINISAPSTATINCTPGATAAAAELCTTNVAVGVGTNNITGYTLQTNATNGSPTALTNSATSPAATIPTLNQSYSSANFPINSWGYTGGLDKSSESGGYNCASNYCPILAYQSNDSNYAPNHVIKVTDAPSTTSNTDITFGAKVDISKPSGTYSTSVTFTAVTNPEPPKTFDMAFAEAGKTKYNNYYKMQDASSSICSGVDQGEIGQVIDIRDNEVYYIGKLADDNCWMLDNMRLDLTNSTVLNSLTTDNTNVDSASLTSLKSGNRTAGDRYALYGFENWNTTSYAFFYAEANANYKNTTVTSYGAGSGKVGVYYNLCAASAGNYCYNGGAGVDEPDTLQDAQYDICPKNWRMPTGGPSGEYQALLTAYNNNQTASDSGSLQYNLSTPLSGDFSSGSMSGQESRGVFWSSTWGRTSYMFHLFINANEVGTSNDSGRNYGYSVRCLVPGA